MHSLACDPKGKRNPSVFQPRIISCVFAILHLCLLKYSRQRKSCWSCREKLCITQFFLSPLFLCFFLLEFRSLALYVPSVLFCVLLCLLAILSILLFFSTLLSIPCFVYSFSVYSLYFLISLIVSFSNLLSLLFSFLYSICSTLMCYYYWICSLSLVKTGINFKKT